jgi:hypothetical protein
VNPEAPLMENDLSMPHRVIQFGTDGWRGVIVADFTVPHAEKFSPRDPFSQSAASLPGNDAQECR